MATRNAQPHLTVALLHELAALYGIQPAYRNSRGRRMESPVESIVAVLRSLGCELPAQDGAALSKLGLTRAIQARKLQTWKRLVEPVIVAWDGVLPELVVRLPARAPRNVDLTLVLEDGSVREWGTVSRLPRAPTAAAHDMATSGLEWLAAETIGRERFVAYRIRWPLATRRTGGALLPGGYHSLVITYGEKSADATLISAPRRCWSGPNDGASSGDDATSAGLGTGRGAWGLFAPLYALRSKRNWGAGDLADLQVLARNTAVAGGSVVATLPLLAAFLDTPFEPSPYRPVSRLFWNEFYLAVERIPEWHRCRIARETWASADLQGHLEVLRASELVDYREVMALKRGILEELMRCFFDGGDTARLDAFASYMSSHPYASEYAGFRARVESEGSDWRDWSEARRAEYPPAARTDSGTPQRRDAPTAPAIAGEADTWPVSQAERYHLFCQWQMEEQLGSVRVATKRRNHPAAKTELVDPPGFKSGLFGTRSGPLDPSDPNSGPLDPCDPTTELPGLFFDLPVGVHPGGFDTWRWRGQFVSDMSSGAPPDSFFSHGQNWESPPLHPEAARAGGHQYFADSLRHNMQHASYLRIDHVMSLHRLFWVPSSSSAADGVYVAYPAEELYAVLSLESHRNQTAVVGEDLGTVPPEVRPAMSRHGVHRTWVAQMSFRPRAVDPVGEPLPASVASLNTHDMFPFAGFIRGDDIRARLVTGQLDEASARREAAARARLVERLKSWEPKGQPERPALMFARSFGSMDVMRLGAALEEDETARGLATAVLGWLLSSSAALTLISPDDLLMERLPQNTPGTRQGHDNWQRKFASGKRAQKRGPDLFGPR